MREDCWYNEVCTNDNCNMCIRYTEMSYLMENSGLPKKKQWPVNLTPQKVDIKSFQKLATIKKDIEKFVQNGNNLYICSQYTGNGKTSWAIKMLLKYFDCIWAGNGLRIRGYFINVPLLLATLKDFNNKDINRIKNILMNVDLIVWDDIASAKLSDYDISQLLTFVDYRISQELSNIYTGNITDKNKLEQCMGSRLASRIWNYSEVVEFFGIDRR